MSPKVKPKRRPVSRIIATAGVLLFASLFVVVSRAGDTEYLGTLESELVPNTADLDQITFRPVRDLSRIKTAKPIEPGGSVTAGRLYHPPSDKSSILTVLVEPEDGAPYIYADLNLDNVLTEDERFELKPVDQNNSYILQAVLKVPFKGSLFKSFPIVVQYFKDVEWERLKEGERLVLQSKEAIARGQVDIEGHKGLVGYAFNPQSKRMSLPNGWLCA